MNKWFMKHGPTVVFIAMLPLLFSIGLWFTKADDFQSPYNMNELVGFSSFLAAIGGTIFSWFAFFGLWINLRIARESNIENQKRHEMEMDKLESQLNQAKQNRAEEDLIRSFELLYPKIEQQLSVQLVIYSQSKPLPIPTSIKQLLDIIDEEEGTPKILSDFYSTAKSDSKRLSVSLFKLACLIQDSSRMLSAFPEEFRENSSTFRLIHKQLINIDGLLSHVFRPQLRHFETGWEKNTLEYSVRN